ncbi:MAG: AAA family ATPase [Anaerostipes sp.]|nr:AAA family ATPase [Anaerostipes sp.]
MGNKYLVRIIRSELQHFKNVAFGNIRYMNYGSVLRDGKLTKNDIVGIYGQNGSGKTAMIEAFDILKCILTGKEIPYDSYEALLDKDGTTKLITEFFMEHEDHKYKIKYEVVLQGNNEEKRIHLMSEKLVYWTKGVSWKEERDILFENPYYDSDSILEDIETKIVSKRMKYFENMTFIHSLQNLAIYCAQNSVSLFFNRLLLKNREKKIEDKEEKKLFEIMQGLQEFGKLYFQVVKVNQLGSINQNDCIPLNIHSESNSGIMQACLPLVMNGKGEVQEFIYNQTKSAIDAINIALKAIVPNLRLELVPVGEEINKKGEKMIQVEAYSIRDGKRFLTKFESEGIKRIISLLNNLIALYNYPEICLVVDELDSGIFEYLLGEILELLNEEAKGQLIFTSHNLRILEELKSQNIICSTTNPENRYIRLVGVEKNHNIRDFYIRALSIGGQKEMLYNKVELQSLGYTFRKAVRRNEPAKFSG